LVVRAARLLHSARGDTPELGRTLLAGDDDASRPLAAVISLWSFRFALRYRRSRFICTPSSFIALPTCVKRLLSTASPAFGVQKK
jgi:hypothetical protein